MRAVLSSVARASRRSQPRPRARQHVAAHQQQHARVQALLGQQQRRRWRSRPARSAPGRHRMWLPRSSAKAPADADHRRQPPAQAQRAAGAACVPQRGGTRGIASEPASHSTTAADRPAARRQRGAGRRAHVRPPSTHAGARTRSDAKMVMSTTTSTIMAHHECDRAAAARRPAAARRRRPRTARMPAAAGPSSHSQRSDGADGDHAAGRRPAAPA